MVFLTAYVESERLERAKLTYPFGYLLKPFQDRDLKITMEMALYVAMVDAERNKAMKAVIEQRRYLSSILQTTHDGFWIVNTDGAFTDVNEAYCIMSGFSRQEFLQLTISDVDAEEDPEEAAAHIERIIRMGLKPLRLVIGARMGALLMSRFLLLITSTMMRDNWCVFAGTLPTGSGPRTNCTKFRI